MESQKITQSKVPHPGDSVDAPVRGYSIRVTRLSVLPPKEPLFSEQCTHVSIVDEAAGEFLEIEQQSDRSDVEAQKIAISSEEWPSLKQAIETLLADISATNR
jgi:hypothetical protein